MRLQDILTKRATATPDPVALASGRGKLTYAALADASDRLAATFLEHGVRTGDRVAIFSDNWGESAIACIAAIKAGMVVCPVHPLANSQQLAARLRAVRARAMVTEARLAGAAAAAIREVESVRLVVLAGTPHQQAAAGCVRFEDAIASRPAALVAGGRPDDVVLLLADPRPDASHDATPVRHRELITPMEGTERSVSDEAAIITSQRLLTREAFAQLFSALRDGKTLIHSAGSASDLRSLSPPSPIRRSAR